MKSDVKRFYNSLCDDQHLKISTIDGIHNVLHQVFQVAVDDNYIRANPCTKMLKELRVAHGHEVEKRKALTVAQQELFLQFMMENKTYRHWYPVFYILLNTGMMVIYFILMVRQSTPWSTTITVMSLEPTTASTRRRPKRDGVRFP